MMEPLQRIIELEAENRRLREALSIYADPANWTINGNYPAPKWLRKPTGLEDAGIFAREALDQVLIHRYEKGEVCEEAISD